MELVVRWDIYWMGCSKLVLGHSEDVTSNVGCLDIMEWS